MKGSIPRLVTIRCYEGGKLTIHRARLIHRQVTGLFNPGQLGKSAYFEDNDTSASSPD
jgi:hypothetical protein